MYHIPSLLTFEHFCVGFYQNLDCKTSAGKRQKLGEKLLFPAGRMKVFPQGLCLSPMACITFTTKNSFIPM